MSDTPIDLNGSLIEEYDQGYIDGLKAYTHWKDGFEYVGTCGTLLSDAIRRRHETYGYKYKRTDGKTHDQ